MTSLEPVEISDWEMLDSRPSGVRAYSCVSSSLDNTPTPRCHPQRKRDQSNFFCLFYHYNSTFGAFINSVCYTSVCHHPRYNNHDSRCNCRHFCRHACASMPFRPSSPSHYAQFCTENGPGDDAVEIGRRNRSGCWNNDAFAEGRPISVLLGPWSMGTPWVENVCRHLVFG